MPDVFTKEKRSQVMAGIRGSGNKATELALMKLLKAHGVTGWRRHKKINFKLPKNRGRDVELKRTSSLSGRGSVRPDFVFPLNRVAVFVDGCFWHGCSTHCKLPSTNTSFWTAKLNGNKQRDKYVAASLRKNGWTVLRLWEHSLKQPTRFIKRLKLALG